MALRKQSYDILIKQGEQLDSNFPGWYKIINNALGLNSEETQHYSNAFQRFYEEIFKGIINRAKRKRLNSQIKKLENMLNSE